MAAMSLSGIGLVADGAAREYDGDKTVELLKKQLG